MKLIKITDPFVTLDSKPYSGSTLLKGKTYLLHDAHAGAIEKLGLGRIIDETKKLTHFDQTLLRFHSHPLKVLFLFDGGLGDAISLALLLKGLEKNYNIMPDVACRREIWRDIFVPFGFSGDWFQPPVELHDIDAHDYIQLRADKAFCHKPSKWNLCIVEELGSAYKVNMNDISLSYLISEEIRKKTALPEGMGVRIGLNFDSRGDIKSYPKRLQPTLLNLLLQAGFELFIFGTRVPNLEGVDNVTRVHDYCGKTTIPELASIVSQMDLMISVDSFIAHLSDILGIKTTVLLSTTRRGIYSWHKNIRGIESMINCSPCGEVGNKCPRGFSQCQAFHHESITPEIITLNLINQCVSNLNNLIHTSMAANR